MCCRFKFKHFWVTLRSVRWSSCGLKVTRTMVCNLHLFLHFVFFLYIFNLVTHWLLSDLVLAWRQRTVFTPTLIPPPNPTATLRSYPNLSQTQTKPSSKPQPSSQPKPQTKPWLYHHNDSQSSDINLPFTLMQPKATQTWLVMSCLLPHPYAHIWFYEFNKWDKILKILCTYYLTLGMIRSIG